jgi:hypothetical protein
VGEEAVRFTTLLEEAKHWQARYDNMSDPPVIAIAAARVIEMCVDLLEGQAIRGSDEHCPYCHETGSHAVNCWSPYRGPGGDTIQGSAHNQGRASPSGPSPTDDVRGMVETLLQASDQQAYKDNAALSTLLTDAASCLERISAERDANAHLFDKWQPKAAARIEELEGALREIEAKCRELADDGIGPVARDHLEIARIARAALRSDTP